MLVENGEWVMYGVEEDDPCCIHTVDELINYINKTGFLPLFCNEIPGFSVEERTVPYHWWCDDAKKDPWKWREIIAARGDIAYGKFFNRKAGFISKKWFPYLANIRRDGYDFDALWDDEKATRREKKIMDLFDDDTELFSYEVKEKAGFNKGGEKNFEGVACDLQMKTYLCARDFRQRTNKHGEKYGWAIAVYSKPEHLWGYEHVTKAYKEEPAKSAERIRKFITDNYDVTDEKLIKKVLGIKTFV